MLEDAGASAVIVGHSERRTLHKETDAEVRAKAQGRLARRPDRHRLHRRDPRRARGRQDPRRAGPPARRLAAGRRDRRQSGGRLRAGLGDRHRPDADRRPTSRRCTTSSAAGSSSATARPGDAVRILYGGSVKPSNAKELMARRQRRRRAGRRRQPQSRRFPGHRRGLPLTAAKRSRLPPGWKCAAGSCRNRPEFLYEGSRTGPVGPGRV